MTSLRARLTKLGTRVLIKRRGLDADQTVRHLRRTLRKPPVSPPLPRGIRVTGPDTAGPDGDWLKPVGNKADDTLLYIHGGAFMAGETATYHPMAARLAKKLNMDVFLPRYPLTPDHPFPAALDQITAAYRHLLDTGHDPAKLVVGGDSAGGNLTLALLLRLRDEQMPLPRCAFTFSPATDATCGLPSIDGNDRSDAMLTADLIRQASALYSNGQDQHHPYISPRFGDYTGLPPLLIAVSEQECLRDDAYAAVNKAREAGVPVTLVSRPDMPHVWPILYPVIPEAGQDLDKVEAFIRETRP
jgi:monoterpene epsilon-lactone hydrolase